MKEHIPGERKEKKDDENAPLLKICAPTEGGRRYALYITVHMHGRGVGPTCLFSE